MVRAVRTKLFSLVCVAGVCVAASSAHAQTTYTSTDGPVTINDNAAASVYPSTITVAGETLPAGKIVVKLNGLTHTNPDDLDILLVSPTGVKLLLMSDTGGTTDVSNITLTLDDAAANQLPDSGALSTASFRPRNVGSGDTIPAPAPAGPYLTSLTNVRGLTTNGVWSLFIVDDEASNSGTLTSWSLVVTPAACVTNTDASGAGSLRQAIIDANSATGKDYICFNIPGAGPHVITVTSEFPSITGETVIDGLTQPGASCGTWPPSLKIVLNGSGSAGDGLKFSSTADNSAVRGLVIQNFSDAGIQNDGADNLTIQCNYLGTDVTGLLDVGNGGDGIRFNTGSDGALIGGVILENLADLPEGSAVVPLGRNLIAGNNSDGIMLVNSSNNIIQSNFIGVDVTGNVKLANESDGVEVSGSSGGMSSDNLIGSDADGINDFEEGNVIGGNKSRGITMEDLSTRTTIAGNRIGLGADGVSNVGNDREGVHADISDLNIIGYSDNTGAFPADRNYISFNGTDGVRLAGLSNRNVVAGNYIGLTVGGAAAGNADEGVDLDPDAEFNTIGSDNDGNNDGFEGNTIAHNGSDGIAASASSSGGLGVADGNIFSRNSIYSNGGLGIDLKDDGVTPNDADDPDGGPNETQNFPIISSIDGSGNIIATLDSRPLRTYRIEFFKSATADPSNYGEGEVFLTSVQVSTNASGDANINASITLDPARPYITATATDLRAVVGIPNDPDDFVFDFPRGTSEFSPVVSTVVIENPSPNPQTVTLCEDTCKTITLTANNPGNLTLSYVITQLPTNGKLFQFDNGPGMQITTVPTPVSDPMHRVVFCPDENENGTPYATFQFKVSNDLALFGPATVTVNVTPVNDRPTFGVMVNPQNPIVFQEDGGQQCKNGFLINFGGGGGSDENSQTLAEVIISDLSDPSGILETNGLTIGTDGKLCVTPKANKCGQFSFRVAVRDSGGTATCTDSNPSVVGIDTSFSIGVTITVECSNDPPDARCRDNQIDLTNTCTAFTAAYIAQLINNGSGDPEDETNVTLAVCFKATNTPVPDFYEFPLGKTELILKVTDRGLPMSRGDDWGDDGTNTPQMLTSTCEASLTVYGEDCNNNGYADTCDISHGRSSDCDGNLVPDECQCLWDNCACTDCDPGKSGGSGSGSRGGGYYSLTNGQLSHLGGGIPGGAKVAEDFELCNGYVHHVTHFTGTMLTNSLPGFRKAKLEFYEDCNGKPSGEPIAKFFNSVINAPCIVNYADGYDLVVYEFDLCDAGLWLDGGKTYWVSLMGLSDGNTQDLSFWVESPASAHDSGALLGSVPVKALGTPGSNWNQFVFGDWSPINDCCIGCVNLCFGITGSSCKVYWDNGPVDLDPPTAGGSPSGANGYITSRSVDNLTINPCKDEVVCGIEAYVWNNCEPPTAFIEIYHDSPCSLNYDFDPPVAQRVGPNEDPCYRFTRTDSVSVHKTSKTVVINGVTYHLYRLFFTDLKLVLEAGKNYWISAGVNGTGSFAQKAFFAYVDDCPEPDCNVKISPGQSRRETPAPRTPWVEGTRDFAFRVFVETEKPIDTMIPDDGPFGTTAPCVADVDGTGDVTVNDLFTYLNAWFTGCP